MTAVERVRRFRRLRALVLGDVMLDRYLEGTASRLCTEGPVPVVRKTAERRYPGGAANTAANIRALGAEVVLLGVVGSDMAGSWLRSSLADRGVDDAWLVEDGSAGTLHKARILADDQYVVRFDEGDGQRCSAEACERIEATLDQVFPQCDLVVVSDYGYGVASEQVIYRLRRLRSSRPVILAVDSKDVRRFRSAGATVVTPNHVEARLAVERASSIDGQIDVDEMKTIGRRLLTAIDAQSAAITMAQQGVLVLDRQGQAAHVPAHPIEEPNDVGAGDSFLAAMALTLAAGGRTMEAVHIGVDAAAIALRKRWTAVAEHQELLQRVSLRDQDTYSYQSFEVRPSLKESQRRLARQLDGDRLAGRSVVFTNGVFDILHAGHVDFLRRAKDLGDVLVVGVNSDMSARRLKGERRPINSERDRLALVLALDPVDHVILFDEDNPAELIRLLRPDFHVKGGDYADEELPEADVVRDLGGKVVILPLLGSLSTSGVIDRILALANTSDVGASR